MSALVPQLLQHPAAAVQREGYAEYRNESASHLGQYQGPALAERASHDGYQPPAGKAGNEDSGSDYREDTCELTKASKEVLHVFSLRFFDQFSFSTAHKKVAQP